MKFKELMDTYGRYISLENQKILSQSWKTLSQKAQKAIISSLKQLEKREVSIFNRAFKKNHEVYNAIQNHISGQRIESLHEIEKK